jgi:capsid protein
MPTLMQRIAKRFSTGGYDATDDRGRRRPPTTATMSEDSHADARRRLILSSSTRDLARNFAVAAWAIRKHLDFVADFTFQGKTPDEGYNRYLEMWWADKSKKYNLDVAARHSHRRAIRLAEAGRTVDGDLFWLKLAGGQHRGRIQAIEGDRIAMPRGSVPTNGNPDDWINGIRIDSSTGRALAYGICKRNGSRKELLRIVPARNIIPHAAYEFRYDQVRGISPIASALNWYRDTYEGFDYALAKMKVGQLFGLQVLSGVGDGGPFTGPGTAEYQVDSDGDGVADSAPRIDLKQGPFVTELDPGEKIEVIESKTPSAETVDFLKLMIHIALRSLDIPYSFFDESFTNFYGSRGGLIQYLHSCHNKVLDLQEFQDEHFKWRAGIALEDGDLELPSGRDFSYITTEFVPGGVPWWNPVQEARGQAMGIAMGVTSPQRVCREIGTNFHSNIDEISAALAYARSKGVDLKFADSTAFNPEITVGDTANG